MYITSDRWQKTSCLTGGKKAYHKQGLRPEGREKVMYCTIYTY